MARRADPSASNKKGWVVREINYFLDGEDAINCGDTANSHKVFMLESHLLTGLQF